MNNSGQGLVILQDSAPVPLQNLKIFGYSTQVTTTGAQLFDKSAVTPNQWLTDAGKVESARGYSNSDYIPVSPGTYAGTRKGSARTAFYNTEKVFVRYLPWDGGSLTVNEGEAFVRLTILTGAEDKYIDNLMFNAGSTAKPWEPYTGGKPSPSPEYPQPIVSAGDTGSIVLTISDGADQSQSLTVSTPNGLPGIPVDSGGNYTDAKGQIFFSSFRDYASKTAVTRVKPFHVDTSPSSAWYSRNTGEYVDLYTYNIPTDYQIGHKNIICEFLPYNYNVFGGANLGCCFNGVLYQPTPESQAYFIFSFDRQTFNVSKEDSQETVIQKFKDYIGADGFSIFYICNPIETPLSEDEITAFQNLTAYSPTTIVSNDANAWMWVQYLLESEMSPWFYPKTEIGLYYKAYAGYETELPAPTCRETKLIKKLLDSSYQLDFEVTERSSRTEKYLWDLISKTNTMLANIPKTDTEKFLHTLLGGEVTEYPVIDCERNYWMSKCVEQ